jgi:hypothetical protein
MQNYGESLAISQIAVYFTGVSARHCTLQPDGDGCRVELCFPVAPRAVRNYCGFIEGGEEWFSLNENHEKLRHFGLHQLRNRYSRDRDQGR